MKYKQGHSDCIPSLRSRSRTYFCNFLTLIAGCLALSFAIDANSNTARAQTCGEEYVLKEGETLADIAARTYGDPRRWTIIFYANQDKIGNNVSLIVPGLKVRLPCVGGAANRSAAAAPAQPAAPAAAPAASATNDSSDTIVVSSLVRRIEFLTADDYAPFTGRSLEGGGMITEVLNKAMNIVKSETGGKLDFNVSWVNDWTAHLNPLLLNRAFDVGFPWIRPDCTDAANLEPESRFRCSRFFFSEPLYEFKLQLFVAQNSPISSLDTNVIQGRTLCRPAGYAMEALDANGRNWLSQDKIVLLRPAAVDDCFRLLRDGTIDGVVINELVGLSSVNALNLKTAVRPVDAPLSLNTLHVVVSKTHPHARTMLYYINEGMRRLRDRGEYDSVVERHLLKFWNAQSNEPDPALANAPAATATTDNAATDTNSTAN